MSSPKFARAARFARLAPIAIVLAVACRSRNASEVLSMQAAADARTFSEQVSAGQGLYAKHCAGCHGAAGEGKKAPALVGLKSGALPVDPPADRKVRKSRFVSVADVADFVVKNMPPNKAGTLTDAEYWSILAFDLHANGIDLPQKLTPDVAKATTIPR